MTQKESDHLRHLLTAFDATALGEGDETAGANTLAAMAITLANLAREGSGIRTLEGRFLPVGCDLLATGSLVTSLVLDEVVTPVGCCQANLLRQLKRLVRSDAAENERNARGLPRNWKLAEAPDTNESEQALFSLMTGNLSSSFYSGAPADAWACVVGDSPAERLEDLLQCPRVFIPAVTPEQLTKQLIGAHRSEALVSLGLNRSGDAAKYGDLCPALMDGLIPGGPSGELVRGRLLVTAPDRILREAATAPGDKTTWLSRLVWLVDADLGPDMPLMPLQASGVIPLPEFGARFKRAAQEIFGNRLNQSKASPIVVEADIGELHEKWMLFLLESQSSLPGITGTARKLLASLTFGLHQLVKIAEPPVSFGYSDAGIDAFARFLIRRMANYRAALLFSAEEEWKLKLKRKILAKLGDGRLDTRTIYRHLGLPAALCEDLLWEMQGDRQVSRHGRKWDRVEGAVLPDEPYGHLPFEV